MRERPAGAVAPGQEGRTDSPALSCELQDRYTQHQQQQQPFGAVPGFLKHDRAHGEEQPSQLGEPHAPSGQLQNDPQPLQLQQQRQQPTHQQPQLSPLNPQQSGHRPHSGHGQGPPSGQQLGQLATAPSGRHTHGKHHALPDSPHIRDEQQQVQLQDTVPPAAAAAGASHAELCQQAGPTMPQHECGDAVTGLQDAAVPARTTSSVSTAVGGSKAADLAPSRHLLQAQQLYAASSEAQGSASAAAGTVQAPAASSKSGMQPQPASHQPAAEAPTDSGSEDGDTKQGAAFVSEACVMAYHYAEQDGQQQAAAATIGFAQQQLLPLSDGQPEQQQQQLQLPQPKQQQVVGGATAMMAAALRDQHALASGSNREQQGAGRGHALEQQQHPPASRAKQQQQLQPELAMPDPSFRHASVGCAEAGASDDGPCKLSAVRGSAAAAGTDLGSNPPKALDPGAAAAASPGRMHCCQLADTVARSASDEPEFQQQQQQGYTQQPLLCVGGQDAATVVQSPALHHAKTSALNTEKQQEQQQQCQQGQLAAIGRAEEAHSLHKAAALQAATLSTVGPTATEATAGTDDSAQVLAKSLSVAATAPAQATAQQQDMSTGGRLSCADRAATSADWHLMLTAAASDGGEGPPQALSAPNPSGRKAPQPEAAQPQRATGSHAAAADHSIPQHAGAAEAAQNKGRDQSNMAQPAVRGSQDPAARGVSSSMDCSQLQRLEPDASLGHHPTADTAPKAKQEGLVVSEVAAAAALLHLKAQAPGLHAQPSVAAAAAADDPSSSWTMAALPEPLACHSASMRSTPPKRQQRTALDVADALPRPSSFPGSLQAAALAAAAAADTGRAYSEPPAAVAADRSRAYAAVQQRAAQQLQQQVMLQEESQQQQVLTAQLHQQAAAVSSATAATAATSEGSDQQQPASGAGASGTGPMPPVDIQQLSQKQKVRLLRLLQQQMQQHGVKLGGHHKLLRLHKQLLKSSQSAARLPAAGTTAAAAQSRLTSDKQTSAQEMLQQLELPSAAADKLLGASAAQTSEAVPAGTAHAADAHRDNDQAQAAAAAKSRLSPASTAEPIPLPPQLLGLAAAASRAALTSSSAGRDLTHQQAQPRLTPQAPVAVRPHQQQQPQLLPSAPAASQDAHRPADRPSMPLSTKPGSQAPSSLTRPTQQQQPLPALLLQQVQKALERQQQLPGQTLLLPASLVQQQQHTQTEQQQVDQQNQRKPRQRPEQLEPAAKRQRSCSPVVEGRYSSPDSMDVADQPADRAGLPGPGTRICDSAGIAAAAAHFRWISSMKPHPRWSRPNRSRALLGMSSQQQGNGSTSSRHQAGQQKQSRLAAAHAGLHAVLQPSQQSGMQPAAAAAAAGQAQPYLQARSAPAPPDVAVLPGRPPACATLQGADGVHASATVAATPAATHLHLQHSVAACSAGPCPLDDSDDDDDLPFDRLNEAAAAAVAKARAAAAATAAAAQRAPQYVPAAASAHHTAQEQQQTPAQGLPAAAAFNWQGVLHGASAHAAYTQPATLTAHSDSAAPASSAAPTSAPTTDMAAVIGRLAAQLYSSSAAADRRQVLQPFLPAPAQAAVTNAVSLLPPAGAAGSTAGDANLALAAVVAAALAAPTGAAPTSDFEYVVQQAVSAVTATLPQSQHNQQQQLGTDQSGQPRPGG